MKDYAPNRIINILSCGKWTVGKIMNQQTTNMLKWYQNLQLILLVTWLYMSDMSDRRDNFGRKLYLLGEEDWQGYCWNPLYWLTNITLQGWPLGLSKELYIRVIYITKALLVIIFINYVSRMSPLPMMSLPDLSQSEGLTWNMSTPCTLLDSIRWWAFSQPLLSLLKLWASGIKMLKGLQGSLGN